MRKRYIIFNIIFVFIAAGFTIPTIIYHWSITALISRILCIYGLFMQANKNRYGLILLIVANALYVNVAYTTGYYGDAIFFGCVAIPFQIFTFVSWSRHLDENKLVEPRRMDIATTIGCVVVGGAAIFGYGLLLKSMGGINSYVDASSTVLSLFAYALTFLRYREAWIAWSIQSLIGITMYSLVGNILMIVSGTICLTLNAMAVFIWKEKE